MLGVSLANPHLAPLGEELRLAIGDSVIAATQLEFQIAMLVATAGGEDDEWLRTTLARVGGARQALKALATEVQEPGFHAQLDRLANDVEELLHARNRIVHSVVVLDDVDGELCATFWHPRSDEERRPKIDELKAQVLRMNALAARALSFGHAAVDWRKANTSGTHDS